MGSILFFAACPSAKAFFHLVYIKRKEPRAFNQIFLSIRGRNMKVLIFLSLVALAVGSLEPSGYQPPGSSSLSSRYLPPNELRPPIAVPSSQYLPSSSSSSSANRYTNSQNVIPTSQYLPPSPSERQNSAPSLLPASTYLPSNRQSVVIPTLPSANYLPAVVNRQTTSPFSPTMSPFSPSTTRISQSLTHGVVGTPSNVYLPGDRITRFGQGGSSSSSSSSFGKSFASGSIPSLTTSPLAKAPSSQYLPSNQFGNSQNFGYDYNAIEVTTPAKYDFEYSVNDGYGNDFGHKEKRSGDSTEGVYSVLLPDGRKQIVSYSAGPNGFRPRISYETGFARSGSTEYDLNANIEGPY
ncbi:uncharacterized protein LOC127278728 [Leptopilina boulardi]|uniref:uncharacterized protein LOC127278728 n=1 Tax=Leptopilina boulardi TaxID=63433 RepID=UPI0021F638DD|nr:uncharacterized protein LOC127278728 [Leptopilina boulardi]